MKRILLILLLFCGAAVSAQEMTDEDFPTQLTKAKAGNVASQGWVGSYYFLNGDYENAVYWSKKAADAGNYSAQLDMAIAYERGEGVEKDLQKAFEYYSSSAKGGDVSAIYMLGVYYHTGEVVKQNLKKARNYYKIAAYNKLAVAQYRYARFCLAGVGGKKDFEEGVGSMQLAAQQGFNPAIVDLAVWYTYGYFVEQNEELGITLFELAAKQGSQEAQMLLGEFIFLGKYGCPQSYAVSAQWYEMAMENPNKEMKLSSIANNLAYCYAYGDDNLPQDFQKAHQTIDKAIEEEPDEANLYDSKGEFYLMQGDKENAQKMWNKVVELAPDFSKESLLYKSLYENGGVYVGKDKRAYRFNYND